MKKRAFCRSRFLLRLSPLLCAAAVTLTTAFAFEESAVDLSQPLDSSHWIRIEGDSQHVRQTDAGLILHPGKGIGTALTYRYYPLRFDDERRPLGNFVTKITAQPGENPANLSFGLRADDNWELRIDVDGRNNKARLVRSGGGSKTIRGPEVSLPDGHGPLTFILNSEGNTIAAEVKGAGEKILIGEWKGRLAPLPEIVLRTKSTENGSAPWKLSDFSIKPLSTSVATLSTRNRDGIPLPGDENIPSTVNLSEIGGAQLGGYLWARKEGAALPLRVKNQSVLPQTVSLRYQIYDIDDNPIFDQDRRIEIVLPPKKTHDFSLPVPDDKYGYFNVHLYLEKVDGTPIEPLLAVGYGITAAPLIKDLAPDHVVGSHKTPFSRIGAKTTRFWDNGGKGVHWSGNQPEPDRWEWNTLDTYVNRVIAAGMDSPIIVLSMTPEWASTDPGTATHRGFGARSPPKDMNDWVEYCRRVATRYKGKVRYYEIWNEPNNADLLPRGYFFHAPAETYFEMLKLAAKAIREADPNALILAPSVTGHYFPFLKRIMEMGGGDYFDILTIHTYASPFSPEMGYQFNAEKSYKSRVDRTREIMRSYGHGDKPIWNTEVGYHNGRFARIAGFPIVQDQIAAEALPGRWPNWHTGWDFRPADPRRAAAFTARFHILTLVYGVQRIFFHDRLFYDGAGLREPFVIAPALGAASYFLNGVTFKESFDFHKDVQAHGFKMADGRYLLTVWRVEQEDLTMGARDERTLGDVQSAPLDSSMLDQRGIDAVEGELPRKTYFQPDRVIPASLTLSVQPDEIFDGVGNSLPIPSKFPLKEDVLYLVFKDRPESITAEVQTKVAGPDRAPATNRSEPGRIIDKTPASKKTDES